MSDGFLGHGTTLTGATTGVIGNIISVSIGGRTRDMIDKSSMDSVSQFREFMAGMADDGELTVEFNFDDGADSVAVDTAFTAATSQVWTLDMGTKTWAITGIISALSVTDPFDEKITMSMTIKATGKGTWT